MQGSVRTFEALQSRWGYEQHLIPCHSLNTKDLALTPAAEVCRLILRLLAHYVMGKKKPGHTRSQPLTVHIWASAPRN